MSNLSQPLDYLSPFLHSVYTRYMHPILARAEARRQTALGILAELQLLERWRAFGNPVLVGAAAYGLVVAPDIDLEIYCAAPRIEEGFEVLRTCALHPAVRKARFANELDGADRGLYWQLRYRHTDGEDWKIDMWSVAHDHPGPTSTSLVTPLIQALTAETRLAILEIKGRLLLEPQPPCGSIHIYRAVLDDNIRTFAQFTAWLKLNPTDRLTDWKPGMHSSVPNE